MGNVKIWYLYNSGFAVRVNEKLLVFDYYRDEPVPNKQGLSGGVISPDDLKGLEVYVFVSHSHHDHFNPCVFAWAEAARRVTYILSDDVKVKAGTGVHFVKANEVYAFEDVQVKTFASNDLGVAFHVEVEGISLFHAGDLNWWHWAGEPDAWNDGMEKSFKAQMALVAGLAMDFAFIPVDPRLGKSYSLALGYFLEEVMPEGCRVFPMHFGDQWLVFDDLGRDGFLDGGRVVGLTHRGQVFTI